MPLHVLYVSARCSDLSFLSVIEVTALVARVCIVKLVLPAKWSYLWITSTQLQVNGSGTHRKLTDADTDGRSSKNRALLVPVRRRGFSGELYYRFALLKERYGCFREDVCGPNCHTCGGE